MRFTTFAADVLGMTLTRGQRVLALVMFDGLEPDQLDDSDREIARTMFGADVDKVPPAARRVRVAVLGRDSGKTELGGAHALYRMLTADVSRCGPGDVPVAIRVAPDLKLARLGLRRALARAKETPSIARLIESEGSDGFTLRRPDGRIVGLEVLAAGRGGAAVRGRSIIEADLDEAAFFLSEEFVVNDADIYRAVLPRLLPGGAINLLSTPWAEIGLFHDLFELNFGRPSTAVVAHAPTLVMRDNDPELAATVATEQLRDPLNAEREFGAAFVSANSGLLFDSAAIDDAIDESLIHPVPFEPRAAKASAGDLAFKSDSSALCIVQAFKERAWLAFTDEVRPTKGMPLAPSMVTRRFADHMKRYQSERLILDSHYIESAREHAAARGIKVFEAPGGQTGKLETHLAARELFNEHRVRIPNLPRLVAQLKAIRSKALAGGGLQISSPRRAGSGHGDIASAFVLALWAIKISDLGEARAEAFRAHVQTTYRQFALMDQFGAGEKVRAQMEISAERGEAAGTRWMRVARQALYAPDDNERTTQHDH